MLIVLNATKFSHQHKNCFAAIRSLINLHLFFMQKPPMLLVSYSLKSNCCLCKHKQFEDVTLSSAALWSHILNVQITSKCIDAFLHTFFLKFIGTHFHHGDCHCKHPVSTVYINLMTITDVFVGTKGWLTEKKSQTAADSCLNCQPTTTRNNYWILFNMILSIMMMQPLPSFMICIFAFW